jgi:hypothetical protein
MRSAVSFQSIPILIDGHGTEGRLLLHEGQLVAVLARLDGLSHDEACRGQWHLEAGFGPCQATGTYLFQTLDAAGIWADDRVHRRQEPSLVPSAAVMDGPPG